MDKTEKTTEKTPNEEIWKKFLKKHWKMSLLIAIGLAIAAIGAILVFLWVVVETQTKGLVPLALDKWAMGHIVTFILQVILWEFLFIGIPILAVAGVIILQWWNKLPDAEKEEYSGARKKKGPRRSMAMGGGGGIVSLIVFITWLIIVYSNGKWNLPFASWTFSYLIYSWLTAFLWDLLIFGAPITVFVIWWLRREMQEQ